MDESFETMQTTSEEKPGGDICNLRDKGQRDSSERAGGWGSLPDVCLRHVFRCLSDEDRVSADLVSRHWHQVMHSPSLWRFRFFHFSGRLSKYTQSEYCSAVAYARSLGVYLESLEVCLCPPRKSSIARRLEQTLTGLLSELTSVKAPLRSLSIVKMELERTPWTASLRSSIVHSLIEFLQTGGSKLTSVCLNGMRNSLPHGLEVLSALALSQTRLTPRCYISSLDLRGFFSGSLANVHLNPRVPCILCQLPGLTYLTLSYSWLSDELLTALQYRGQQEQGRHGNPLQSLSLHCSLHEPHQQLVFGSSWSNLVSTCPELKVRITVEQVIDTNRLARILLPEIPLTEFDMTGSYSTDEDWSAKPVLRDLLPQYRRSLQFLSLDLRNSEESLDEELLHLVKVCERLEQLRVWAFLDLRTMERLLHMRLTKRSLLNKIKVRIYSMEDEIEEKEEQLEQILCPYLGLPPELDLYVMVYPFV
ncbi:F-box only protein 39-like [Labrus mixtus]|uniref:F-box only protein 39-like n=1 Tax=Labrus mixtus TaxID=508554 RepID=UPI0029C0BA82|nr:F-box only protein 39-like [Labrus mixtus]